MGPAEPVDPAAAAEPAGSEAEFHFVEPVGPRRFVFQMDAEGRFTFVSPDFARAVGPISAGIVDTARLCFWRLVRVRKARNTRTRNSSTPPASPSISGK